MLRANTHRQYTYLPGIDNTRLLRGLRHIKSRLDKSLMTALKTDRMRSHEGCSQD
ncbi:hypothetical protein DPMN_037737 [Dreissena polymorpha]|uniref:Uncharacterized protein n=1 Tax=Dreissena polymorpha TaxID=45954 RepID=A0A9D4MBI2_DREPO|nr:hypothetical protein DPMN_037737 [Dreissena polymorpha]